MIQRCLFAWKSINLQKVQHRSVRGAGAHCWQRRLHGDLCVEMPGLPRAGDSWLQNLSHAGGTSGKVYLRNSRKHQRGRSREQKGETTEGKSRSEEEEQLHSRPDIPHGEPTLEQRKDVRRKEQQRETARLTVDPPPSNHLLPCWRAWDEGVKLSLRKRRRKLWF